MARDEKGHGAVLIVVTHREDRRVLFDALDGQDFDAVYTAKDFAQAHAFLSQDPDIDAVLVEFVGRRVGLNQEDRITLLFGGSKKSMATGIPMAQVLFAGGAVGTLILPLMIFHQIQLMVCAVLAQRYAQRPEGDEVGLGAET